MRGCGSKVSTVSAPRITSRWPRWTPSNSPTATWRGPALGVGEPGDVHQPRKPTTGLSVPSAARLGERDQAVARRRSRTVPRRPARRAGTATPWAGAARVVARQLDGGQEGERVGERHEARRRRRRRTGRSPCGAAPGSRRRRGRRRASARRCPSRALDRERGAVVRRARAARSGGRRPRARAARPPRRRARARTRARPPTFTAE